MSELFARNTAYGMAAGVVSSIGRLCATIIVARILGVHDNGIFAFVLWIVGIVGAVIDLGIYASLTRYLPEVSRNRGDQAANSLSVHLLVPFLIVACLAFVVLSMVGIWMYYDPDQVRRFGLEPSSSLWVLMGLYCAVQALGNFAIGYLQGMQRFHVVAALAVGSTAIQLFVCAVGSWFFGVFGAVLGYAAAMALPVLALWSIGRPTLPVPKELLQRVKKFSRFAWASGIASALIWARPEIAFVKHYQGNEAVGLYSVGYTLASLAVQGPALLTTGLLPFFSENSEPHRSTEVRKMIESGTRLIAFLVLPTCFITAALVPQLIPIMFGPDFVGAVPATMILVASAALLGNMHVLTSAIAGQERNDFSFACNLVGAALMLSLSFVLVPSFGIVGAASARALVQIFLLGATILFVTRWLNYDLPYAHLLKLLLAAVLSAVAAYALVIAIPNVLGALVGGLVGAATYLILVRFLEAIPSADLERMQSIVNRLPGPLGGRLMPIFVRCIRR